MLLMAAYLFNTSGEKYLRYEKTKWDLRRLKILTQKVYFKTIRVLSFQRKKLILKVLTKLVYEIVDNLFPSKA